MSAVSVVSESAASVSYVSHVASEQTMDIFDNRYHIPSVTCPVQIIAGTNDSVTSYDQAEYLCEIALHSLPLISLKGADHNDVWSGPYFKQTLAGIRRAINA